MRLKPAIIILTAFAVVIAGLAALLVIYREPGPEQGGLVKTGVVFPELKPDEVVRIEFAGPKGALVLERIGSEKWRIARPFESPASGEKAIRLLGGLLGLKAVNSFVPKSMADYELDQPRFRVSVTTQSHGVFRIAFGTDVAAGGAGGDTYVDVYSLAETGGSGRAARLRYASVGDGSRVLVVPDDIVPLIDVDPSTFREPALVYRETRDRFERISPADVARVCIRSRADGDKKRTMTFSATTFSATRERGWRMVEPVDARTDDARVAQAVRAVLDLAAADGGFVEDNPQNLSKYGLDEPSAEVELELLQPPGGRKAVLPVRFGNSPADNGSLIYAQSGARSTVLLVKGDTVRRLLAEPVEFFRDRRLVTFAPQSIESAEFVRVNYRRLKVVRDHGAPNRWRIDEPVVSGAQSEQVEQLLAGAAALTVSAGGFVGEDGGDPAKYGFDTPSMTISFTLRAADGKTAPPVRILIGKPFPDNDRLFYAKNTAEPSVVLVARNALDALSPDVRTLRSRRLFEEFRSGDASEIVIERGGRTLKLEKNKQLQWTAAEPKELPVDSSAVAEFLEAVGRVAVEAWPADRPLDYAIFGLDKPCATVAVKFAPQKDGTGGSVTKRILCFGRRTPGGGRCYVWVPPEPNVYEIKADLLARIESGGLAFRSRQVLSFNPAQVRSVHIEGGRAEYKMHRTGGAEWMLSAPIPALADIASVDALLDTLRGLTARQLLFADVLPADPQYGLAKSYRKVTLIIEQDGTLVSRTLLVGASVKDQKDADRYAALAEDRLVFTMPGSVLKGVDAEFISTAVVNVMKAEINRITVEHRDGWAVQAARTASGWQITSHKDVVADADKIEALAEEAGWVRAESFAALNQENLERYGLARPLLTVTIGRPARLPIVLQIGDRAEPLAPLPPGKRKMTLYYATGGDLPAVCLVEEDKVKALNKRLEDLIKKGGP